MVDIIVPVYNTDIDLLKTCLTSIKNQTYKNWNLIIIDDGSEYNLALWLDEWCANNAGCFVCHNKNMGVSAARNTGIKLSKGEYICYIDADDEISEDFLKEAVEVLEKKHLDIVMSSILEVDQNGKMVCQYSCEHNLLIETEKQKEELIEYMLIGYEQSKVKKFGNTMLGRVYAKVIRRELLQDISFEMNLCLHEDNLFCLELFQRARRIGVLNSNKARYFLRVNTKSLTHTIDCEKQQKQEEIFAKYLIARLEKEENIKVKKAISVRVLWTLINYYISLVNNADIMTEVIHVEKTNFFNIAQNAELLNTKECEIKKKIFTKIVKIRANNLRHYCLYIIIKIIGVIRFIR